MPTPVPTLSEDGWSSAPITMGDYLLSHFFLAEYSQSSIYRTHVASLPYLIQNNKGNNGLLKEKTKDTLADYFNRYFTGVEVQTDVTEDPAVPGSYILKIYVSYTAISGMTYNLGRLVTVANTKIAKIIKENNQ